MSTGGRQEDGENGDQKKYDRGNSLKGIGYRLEVKIVVNYFRAKDNEIF
jgi:hypothetical protein